MAGGILANTRYQVEFFNENIMIQNSLLNVALKLKLKRTIFLGTSCIYPHKTKTPIKEDQLLTGKLHNSNEGYAMAKIAGMESTAKIKSVNSITATTTNRGVAILTPFSMVKKFPPLYSLLTLNSLWITWAPGLLLKSLS